MIKNDNNPSFEISQEFKPGQRWYYGGKIAVDSSGTLADLSQMKAKMTFRAGDETHQELITLTHGDGIVLLDGSGDHNYELDLSSEKSLLFNNYKTVLADFFIIDGKEAHPILDVEFEIKRSQTIWNQN